MCPFFDFAFGQAFFVFLFVQVVTLTKIQQENTSQWFVQFEKVFCWLCYNCICPDGLGSQYL